MKFTENLAVSKELNLVDGINFARTGSPRSARSYDPLPDEPKARELQLEERIMDNVVDFLDSHVLQLRMPKAFTEDNSIEEEGKLWFLIFYSLYSVQFSRSSAALTQVWSSIFRKRLREIFVWSIYFDTKYSCIVHIGVLNNCSGLYNGFPDLSSKLIKSPYKIKIIVLIELFKKRNVF